MKGLLIKDWKLLKNQGRFFLMILAISLIPLFFTQSYVSFITSYLTFIFSVFVLSTLSYDSYDNGMVFLLSLPVSRRIYVQEKYLFSLLLASGSWLFSLILRLAVFSLRTSLTEGLEAILMDPIYLILALLFLGYSLPLHLKFGNEKGRILSFFTLGLFAFGVFTLVRTTQGLRILSSLERTKARSPLSVIMVSILLCALFFGISYHLSVRILEKKEF